MQVQLNEYGRVIFDNIQEFYNESPEDAQVLDVIWMVARGITVSEEQVDLLRDRQLLIQGTPVS